MRIAIQTPTTRKSAPPPDAAIYAGNLLRALREQTGQDDSVIALDEDGGWWRGRRRLNAVDICHAIGQWPAAPAGVPMIPLVQDLAPLHFPEQHSLCAVRRFSRFLDRIDRFAAVQTLTAFTRDELLRHTRVDPTRVAVLAPGVDELFLAPGRPEDAFELQAIGLLPQQFFLSVGCLQPLGNFATLAEAYCALPQRVKALLPLVIAGGRLHGARALSPAVQAEIDAGNIRLLGHVPRFLLRVLYRGALLALFPAVYGGFGLAVAEARVCGAALAVSRDTALAELAGPLATLVEARDVAGWAGILADQVGRGRFAGLVERNRAEEFSWARTARETRALYARVLN